MSADPVVYWELASHDAAKTVDFLKKVFDWEMPLDRATGIYELPPAQDARPVGGGVFTLRRARLPFLTIYIRVTDLEEKARLVEENGGLIVIAPYEVSPGTRICLFNEPSGVTLAMIEARPD